MVLRMFSASAVIASRWFVARRGLVIGLLSGAVATGTLIFMPVAAWASERWGWRAAFIGGAIAGPMLLTLAFGHDVTFASPIPDLWLVIGGLIVGVGVYFGSGCTSGHGVCGLARLSPRSIVATLIFMGTTAATVFVVRHLIGGL